ncbi:MAG: sensory box protein, partial [Massilia sp.]|nr:sensory box protein [Massilia sp.]
DIGLPDMNGYELARRTRALPGGAGMLLVAATGWGQDADKQLAFDAGFDHHLTKPIDFERLRTLLA